MRCACVCVVCGLCGECGVGVCWVVGRVCGLRVCAVCLCVWWSLWCVFGLCVVCACVVCVCSALCRVSF